jgi:DNA-binding XRE family transcriptional regulator
LTHIQYIALAVVLQVQFFRFSREKYRTCNGTANAVVWMPSTMNAGGCNVSFAQKLKALRLKAGLTQVALAKASGRGLGAIRDYEQGNREPLLSTAFQLAKALGVSIEVFAEDATEKPAPPKRKKSDK